MERHRYFSFKQYDQKVFVVTEHYAPSRSHSFGVVWSRERCAVIDPGLGLFGDVRKFIEGLTGFEKAIFSVSTCGAAQCVGGAGVFDEAFINGPDYDLAKANMRAVARMEALRRITGDELLLAGAAGENVIDNGGIELIEFHDPRVLRSPESLDHFHLGGVHLCGEPLPGHTPGSIVISVHGNDVINCMFTGKSLSAHTNYLQDLDRAGFEAYRGSLKALIDKTAEYTAFPEKRDGRMYFFSADSPEPFFKDVPERLLTGVDELLAGRTGGDIPAAYEGKRVRMHLAGSAVILYDPALL